MIPLAFVTSSISPCILSITVFSSLIKLSNIHFRRLTLVVIIDHSSSSMKVILLKGPSVQIILRLLLTFWTTSNIINKISFEVTMILEKELPSSIFQIIGKTTRKSSSIRKHLLSRTFFQSLFPFSTVHPVQITICVLTISLRFVISPLSLIKTSIEINHVSKTVSRVVLPHSNIVESAIVKHDSVACPYFNIMLSKKITLSCNMSSKCFLNIMIRLRKSLFDNSVNITYLRIFFKELILHILPITPNTLIRVPNYVSAVLASDLQQHFDPISTQSLSNIFIILNKEGKKR